MKRKVDTLANKYTKLLETLASVDTIILGEPSEIEYYDPYIMIEFDVFYEGDILSTAERKKLFGNPGAFETSPVYPVDKFFNNGLPVIINYRNIKSVNALFDRIDDNKWVFRREATSALYRIKNGQVQISKSDWFNSIRKRLDDVHEIFWKNILTSSRFLIESSLMEMEVAIIKNNSILYQISLNSFIQNVCHFVFALNKEFIPYSRLLHGEIRKLKKIPDEFISRFDGVASFDSAYSPERKVEIAKLIAKTLISLDFTI